MMNEQEICLMSDAWHILFHLLQERDGQPVSEAMKEGERLLIKIGIEE